MNRTYRAATLGEGQASQHHGDARRRPHRLLGPSRESASGRYEPASGRLRVVGRTTAVPAAHAELAYPEQVWLSRTTPLVEASLRTCQKVLARRSAAGRPSGSKKPRYRGVAQILVHRDVFGVW